MGKGRCIRVLVWLVHPRQAGLWLADRDRQCLQDGWGLLAAVVVVAGAYGVCVRIVGGSVLTRAKDGEIHLQKPQYTNLVEPAPYKIVRCVSWLLLTGGAQARDTDSISISISSRRRPNITAS
jgi:hypothetical protein